MNALKRGREKRRCVGPHRVGRDFFFPVVTNWRRTLVPFGSGEQSLQSLALNSQPRYIGLDILESRLLVVLHALALHQVFTRNQRCSEYCFP